MGVDAGIQGGIGAHRRVLAGGLQRQFLFEGGAIAQRIAGLQGAVGHRQTLVVLAGQDVGTIAGACLQRQVGAIVVDQLAAVAGDGGELVVVAAEAILLPAAEAEQIVRADQFPALAKGHQILLRTGLAVLAGVAGLAAQA